MKEKLLLLESLASTMTELSLLPKMLNKSMCVTYSFSVFSYIELIVSSLLKKLIQLKLFFCRYFKEQLKLNEKLRLPMFLHCRAASADFLDIIGTHKGLIEECGGVVHSFDGTTQEVKAITDLGLHIGINGWYVFKF